jgi:hypothetical protein
MMNNPFYVAKKEGKTENGAWYAILQDDTNSFHISVSLGDEVIYDCFKNPPSIEYLDEQVMEMEAVLIGSGEEQNDG